MQARLGYAPCKLVHDCPEKVKSVSAGRAGPACLRVGRQCRESVVGLLFVVGNDRFVGFARAAFLGHALDAGRFAAGKGTAEAVVEEGEFGAQDPFAHERKENGAFALGDVSAGRLAGQGGVAEDREVVVAELEGDAESESEAPQGSDKPGTRPCEPCANRERQLDGIAGALVSHDGESPADRFGGLERQVLLANVKILPIGDFDHHPVEQRQGAESRALFGSECFLEAFGGGGEKKISGNDRSRPPEFAAIAEPAVGGVERAECGVGRGLSSAQGRVVDDVVVDEGACLEQFEGATRIHNGFEPASSCSGISGVGEGCAGAFSAFEGGGENVCEFGAGGVFRWVFHEVKEGVGPVGEPCGDGGPKVGKIHGPTLANLYPQRGETSVPSTGFTGVLFRRTAIGWDGDMKKTTVSISKPEEALALIPHVLGYRPSNHFVVFGLQTAREGRGRVGPAFSFSLDTNPLAAEMAQSVVEIVSRFEVRVCVFALYVPSLGDFAETGGPCVLADILEEVALSQMGCKDALFAAFVADSTTWVRADAPVFRPRPMSTLDGHAKRFEEALGEPAPASGMPAIALPELPQALVASARREAERWRVLDPAARAAHGAHAWEAILSRLVPDEEPAWLLADGALLGRANAALGLGSVRDSIMFHAWGGDDVHANLGVDGEDDDGPVAAMLRRRPDPRAIRSLIAVLDLCAAAGADDDPYAQAVAAYFAWWGAWRTLAESRARGALERDADNALARLVLSLVDNLQLPEWVHGHGGFPQPALV